MRIAWLAQHVWPKTIGGVELQVEALSAWHRAWGHDVELWIGDLPGRYRQTLPDGRRVFGLGLQPARGPLWRIGPLLKLIRTLRSLPRHVEAVFSPDPLLSAGHLVKNHRVPLIYCPGSTVVGSLKWHFPGSERVTPFRRWFVPAGQYLVLEKFCLRRSAGLVAVSESVRRQMRRVDPGCEERVSVIPTGFDPAVVRARQPADGFTVICVARLHAVKNIRHLLAAWPGVHAAGKRLWIVGDGEERQTLEALVPDDTVRFWGERLDVPELLARSDVFVLPSLYEACPIAVIEAMAAGLPCLTLRSVEGLSDVGASGELVIDGVTGFCVDPRDPDALTERLNHLAEHPEECRRMGEAARRRAYDHLTWEQAARSYLERAECLLARSRRLAMALV